MASRGIRNNNPGNIRISDTKWQGKVIPSKDTDFEQFVSPAYGIRALAKLLLNDEKTGVDTVRKVITKYAPSSENNTAAYIAAVAEHLTVGADDTLDFDNYETMYGFIAAIIMHENGDIPYSDAVLNQGINMAGVYNVPKPALASQPEAKAAAGAGAIATVSCVTSAVQNASPAIPLIQQVISVAPWVIAVIAFLGCIYLLYVLYKKHTQISGV